MIIPGTYLLHYLYLILFIFFIHFNNIVNFNTQLNFKILKQCIIILFVLKKLIVVVKRHWTGNCVILLIIIVIEETYGAFSHDVTTAMLVFQTNPIGVELFSYANAFFCSDKFAQMLATRVKILHFGPSLQALTCALRC